MQKTSTLAGLQRQLLELKIEEIQKNLTDHETRIRKLEEAVTKFNTILWLTMGGGLVGIVNLYLQLTK